jgi:hypothetical protein
MMPLPLTSVKQILMILYELRADGIIGAKRTPRELIVACEELAVEAMIKIIAVKADRLSLSQLNTFTV